MAAASAYDLIGTGGSGGLVNGVNGNQVGVADPGLGTLADNGGQTQTIALLSNSPAIDKGSNALAVDPSTGQPLSTDQRGPGFPRIVGGTVNIGDFELQATTYLVVTTQPPASVTAGAGFGLTVTAEDKSGDVLSSFEGPVTVGLATNPGGATLGGTLTMTAQSGVATFSGLTIDTVGSYQIQATSSGLSTTISDSITIDPALAQTFAVTTNFPSPDPAGTAGTVTVTAVDAFNNVVGSGPEQYVGTAYLSSTDIKVAGLPASYTFTAADSGSHVFTNVILKTAGSQTITAADSVTSTIKGSVPATVVPALASQVAITSTPLTLVAGNRGQVTVQLEDVYGNLDATATADQTISVSTTSAAGAFDATQAGTTPISSVVIPAGQGGASFYYGDTQAGTPTVTASDTAFTSPPSQQQETVNPAAASKLVFGQQPTSTAAGTSISPAVTVQVEDQFSNVVTTDTSTVTLTLSSGTFEGGSTTATAAASGGVATFSGLKIDAAGSYTLAATDGTLTASGASNSFIDQPGGRPQGRLRPAADEHDRRHRHQPVRDVKVEDQFNNVVTTDSSTVTLTLSSGTFEGGSTTVNSRRIGRGSHLQRPEDRHVGQLHAVGNRWDADRIGCEQQLHDQPRGGQEGRLRPAADQRDRGHPHEPGRDRYGGGRVQQRRHHRHLDGHPHAQQRNLRGRLDHDHRRGVERRGHL